MKKYFFFVVLILVAAVSCAPQPIENSNPTLNNTESTIQQPTTQQATNTPYPTYTIQPTYTPFPTFTPLPSSTPTITQTPTPLFTPTISATPTETATPTSSPTPFNIASCINFTFPTGMDADYDKIREKLEPLVGKCVRFYYQEWEFLGSFSDYILGDDLVYAAKVSVITDDITPADAKKPSVFGRVWGVLEAAPDRESPYVLRLRKAEQYTENQYPMEDDDRYFIGQDGDRLPGVWKSGVSPTMTGECYWAIINPTTGDIKQNHFGIGGMTVRLSEGDIFETNNNCTDWYYLGP